MGCINLSDVGAFRFGDEIVCLICATEEEYQNLKESEILLKSYLCADIIHFCDRCGAGRL
jgi:hypothetical protein